MYWLDNWKRWLARRRKLARLAGDEKARKKRRQEERRRARSEEKARRAQKVAQEEARAKAAQDEEWAKAAGKEAWRQERQELLQARETLPSLYMRLDSDLRYGRLGDCVQDIEYFRRASGVCRLKAVSDFMTFVGEDLPVWSRSAEFGRRAVLHFAVWGKMHRQRFVWFCVPSLLAAENLPRLSQSRSVLVLIHSDEATRMWLSAQPAVRLLESHAQVVFETFPEQDISTDTLEGVAAHFFRDWKYFMLGGLQRRAMALSTEMNAHLALLFSDNCIAAGSLSRWFQLAEQGHEVVTTQVPRTQLEAVQSALEEFRSGPAISIPPAQLVALQIEHLHESNIERTVFDGNGCFTGAAQILFRTRNGFAMRGFHYHPIVSSPTALRIAAERYRGMVPADEYILAAALESGTPAAVFLPETGIDSGVMELSGVEMAYNGAVRTEPATVEEQALKFAQGALREASTSQWTLMKHRVHYSRPGSLPVDGESEDEARFMSALQASRVSNYLAR